MTQVSSRPGSNDGYVLHRGSIRNSGPIDALDETVVDAYLTV